MLCAARMNDDEGATYTFIFEADNPLDEAREYADQRGYNFIEVIPAADFIGGDVYELVTP